MDTLQDSLVLNLCQHLKEKLRQLSEEQAQKDRVLSSLIQERNTQLHTIHPPQLAQLPSHRVLTHYQYVLPLMNEIHLLELKIKHHQKEYEERKLLLGAARQGQAVFTASLEESECVLKRWSRELTELSSKDGCSSHQVDTESDVPSLTNITYLATHDRQLLKEDLGFTVLCQGVHVRVQIMSEMVYSSIHTLSPMSARIGVNSDTFVPQLEETLKAALSDDGHISEIVSLVSKYIGEDMAPYVIVIPLKKKAKKTKRIHVLPSKTREFSGETGIMPVDLASCEDIDVVSDSSCTINKAGGKVVAGDT